MTTSPPTIAALTPPSRDRRQRDEDQLKLLGSFHFVGAGFAVLGMGFLLLHYLLMRAFFANPQFWQAQKQAPPPAILFDLFKWFYLLGALWFLISLTVNLLSGFCLVARRARTFSLVVAGFNCLHMPLGTVLGVFTMIVLLRDSVRELYESRGLS